ncbi:MAG: S49 family peptidase [Verrucomicrobia bacterium]|nr:S49 family peptidase [Verrucomicrobiota bacterium]MDE3100270.1 S49 family peptidase [Verrucomicrobiota bacterium]
MPNWGQVLQEIQQVQAEELTKAAQHQQRASSINCINQVKRGYLAKLHRNTGRNVIAYYSGFMSKPGIRGTEINDEDKNGFMMAIHTLKRNEGLDIILHTPGGGITSTQSIVNYLHKMFRADRGSVSNIRAIVPQIAMSAGTMIACSCKEIWMAKHSNLGPIDPQVNGWPAYGVLEEFKRACREVKADRSKIPLWQSIIGQYRPAFLGHCQNAIDLSNSFVRKQLATVMFKGQRGAREKAAKVVRALAHYGRNKTHDRHIHFDECLKIGLNVKLIEDKQDSFGRKDADFQDLILTVHHCYMHLLMNTPAFKVIENHLGIGFCKNQAMNPPTRPNQSQAGFESI